MRILWFSGRSLTDLCATTQTSLASGLTQRGHHLTFINSDEKGSHADWPWEHQAIPINAPLGLRSRTLGNKMKAWFIQQKMDTDCVILVDWRVAKPLIPLLVKKKLPWILIDRSPPADKGVLSTLQWPSWKRSWKYVSENGPALGCVVSQKHAEFVSEKMQVLGSSIVTLPAGVDLDHFQPGKRFSVLTMVYHGRLDRHRGVLSLPMLLEKMRAKGIVARLMLVGEGDAFASLETMAARNESIEVHASLPQKSIASLLSQCHVGLLPMPERKMWTIASPLKRSEYAASGLLIFGLAHSGHRFNEGGLDWMKLVEQHDFHDEAIAWLGSLDESLMETLGKKARAYAEVHLSWEKTVDALEQAILSFDK
jgi:glycosyltransferase involved in cell wall biosynthesis